MEKSIFKRLLLSGLVLVAGTSLLLAFHIYSVRAKKSNEKILALGRIDFKEAIPPQRIGSIRDFTASLNGVHNAVLNAEQGTLVFMYYPAKQSCDYILSSVQNFSHLKSERYMPNKQEMGMGCPVSFKSNDLLSAALALFN
ncbi:MAG: hypothetical protein SGJ00_06320 [bacterium]|nr:hypothetical protein [bacterium]